MDKIDPNADLEKCNIVKCPRNSADIYEKTGHCELSNPSLKETDPEYYMTPGKCLHKKFIERFKK